MVVLLKPSQRISKENDRSLKICRIYEALFCGLNFSDAGFAPSSFEPSKLSATR